MTNKKLTKKDYFEPLTKSIFSQWKQSDLNLYRITKYSKIRKRYKWNDVKMHPTLHELDWHLVTKWYEITDGSRNATAALNKMTGDMLASLQKDKKIIGIKKKGEDDCEFRWWKRKCQVCKVEEKHLKKCGLCKAVYYCCVECQKVDWEEHKKECKNLVAFSFKNCK